MQQIIANNTKNISTIDDCDYDLNNLIWSQNPRGHLVRNNNGKTELLHRVIAKRMKLDLSKYIDHIDGNKLNNCRNNLRAATNQQNQFNTKKQINNTTNYKGVTYDKTHKRYLARIRYGKNQRKHLGSFTSAIEAAKTYNIAAIKYHGEFALLNNV